MEYLTPNQKLAVQVAKDRGAYVPIVMATIEAETNFRNVLGEYQAPSARWGGGFGQIHPAWHSDLVKQIARELNIQLPQEFDTIPWRRGAQPWDLFLQGDKRAFATRYILDNIIIRNDLFSMHLAVEMINRKWRQANGDWEKFTRLYVGQGIPDRDIERRRKIWHRWKEKLIPEPTPGPTPAPQPILSVTIVYLILIAILFLFVIRLFKRK